LNAAGVRLKYVAGSRNAAAVAHAARKFNAEQAVTDARLLLDDPEVNAVFIVTGHNTHARFTCHALAAGKHVFVEKPLALNEAELEEVAQAVGQAPRQQLAVGFNRR